MPVPSPFHERTQPLCRSYRWKEWGGYYAVCAFDLCHEREYFAFRHACGLTDVTPLFKYDVVGKDAGEYLARLMTRDARKLKPGRVAYGCWCDDEGKVLDDGTVACIEPDRWFLTAADPCFDWLVLQTRGYDVEVTDASEKMGALAVQGPTSRDVLAACSDADLKKLKFFRVTEAKVDGVDVRISRTGYTGDLGYEIWVDRDHAVRVWDAVMDAGEDHGILPAGLDALDMARVEAGFVMAGVDYFSARHCIIEARKSTPFEIDLGWAVHLDREPFIGQEALRREVERGSALAFVGLDIDWVALERLYAHHDLPPSLPSGAWRSNIPVYDELGDTQIGRATSGAFSPTLKKNLALATIDAEHAEIGTRLTIEQTVEYERHRVPCVVAKKPFFDPPRKRKP
jgi:aminomethyltransferase